jgi:type I restriction enzyme S subunit
VTERVGERKLTPVSISAGLGFVPQAEKFGRDISGNQYQLYTLVRDGDFVFNKGNSLKFPQGCIYLLRGWGQVAAPNVFICFRLKDSYSNGFFQNCFEQNQHGRQLKRHITSGARSNGLLNISKDTFFGVEIPTPSPAEQQKIAECLSSVDELIAAQTRKVDGLKTHKKGLMHQLFPREGETQPGLRFPEFQNAGEWAKKKLGSVCEIQRGKFSHRPRNDPKFFGGPYPFIQTGDVVRSHGGPVVASQSLNEEGLAVSKLFKPTIVLITIAANIGDTGLLQTKGCFTDSVVGLIPTRHVIPMFLELIMRGQKEYLNKVATTGAQKNINNETLRELSVLLPSVPEQQRIASCLSSLDALITAEAQKLEVLKTHKKGLMQHLFPLSGAVAA